MSESYLESDRRLGVRPGRDEAPERSLRDVYYVLFRHKGKMILLFLAVMLAAGFYTFWFPEVYESEAKLLLRAGQETVLDRSGSDGLITSVRPSETSQINTEVDILESRDLVEKVVEAIGLSAFVELPEGMEAYADTAKHGMRHLRSAVARGVMGGLDVQALSRSSVVRITYRAPNPWLAQQVVGGLIDFYLDKHLEVHRGPGSYDFFAGQMEQVRGELARAQTKLGDLRNETGIASIDEQRHIILSRIGSLREEIEQADAEAFASQAKMRSMQNVLGELPETLVMSETTQSRLSLGRQEPTASSVTKGLNATRQSLESAMLAEEAHLASLQARRQALEDQLAKAKEELRGLERNAARFAELEREIEIQEAKYTKYSEHLEKARVDRTLETERISNVSVLEPATYPAEPVPRQRRRNLGMALFLALLGSVALAYLAEYMDHTLKKPEDVESKLHLRAVASVPYLSARAVGAVRGLLATTQKESPRLAAGEAREDAVSGTDATDEPTALAIPSDVKDLYGYDDLPDRLFLTSDGSEELPRVLALTSCYSGEGVTTVGSHLAVLLAANADGRVLFVDANLRRPSGHLVFGLNTSPGLTEFLVDGQSSAEIVQPSGVPNLDVVTAGERNISFSRRSEFTALHDLVDQWRSKYRFVLLDTPAVRGGMFAGLLGNLVDGVVLVVEAERVRWEVVRRVHERLLRAKANVLGVALNKRKYYVPEWLYKRL